MEEIYWFEPRDAEPPAAVCLRHMAGLGLTIVRQLNEGSYGQVFLLSDGSVLKYTDTSVKPDISSVEVRMAENEAIALSLLAETNCPYVVEVYQAAIYSHRTDPMKKRILLYMEPLQSLTDSLARGGLTEGDAVMLTRDIGRALSALEQIGVVHNDIKVENCFVRRRMVNGHEEKTYVLGDFGSSWFVKDGFSSACDVVGTPGYIAPERCEFRLNDIRSRPFAGDVYSLGVTMFRIITATLLPTQKMSSIKEVLCSYCSEGLARVISKASQYALPERYAHAVDMLSDLHTLCSTTNAKLLRVRSYLEAAKEAYCSEGKGSVSQSLRLLKRARQVNEAGSRRFELYLQYNEAEKQRERACRQRNWQRLHQAESDMSAARKELLELGQRGDYVSQGIYALLLDEHDQRRLPLLERSADAGWACAQYMCGKTWWQRGNRRKAAHYLLASAEQNYKPALRQLASIGEALELPAVWKRRVRMGKLRAYAVLADKELNREYPMWI